MSNLPIEDELKGELHRIMKAPLRSQISTADIAVAMLSSTGLNEKIHDIMQLIHHYATKRELEARIDENGKYLRDTNQTLRLKADPARDWHFARQEELESELKAQKEQENKDE